MVGGWIIQFLVIGDHLSRRRRRDETVLSRCVGVGGVYMNLQLATNIDFECRRIRSTIWKLTKQTP